MHIPLECNSLSFYKICILVSVFYSNILHNNSLLIVYIIFLTQLEKKFHWKYLILDDTEFSSLFIHVKLLYDAVDGIMAPKDVHILVSETCKCVTLHGKQTLQMSLRWRPWERETILNYLCSGGSNVITRVFIRERRVRIKVENVTTEPEVEVIWGSGHEPKNANSLEKW